MYKQKEDKRVLRVGMFYDVLFLPYISSKPSATLFLLSAIISKYDWKKQEHITIRSLWKKQDQDLFESQRLWVVATRKPALSEDGYE